ncbi:MAG: tetratricopeptide repeat protein [Saprospiraceae bacterium]|nr:tetratricopeptide repeat protein [Saprospiraceae bacterium]
MARLLHTKRLALISKGLSPRKNGSFFLVFTSLLIVMASCGKSKTKTPPRLLVEKNGSIDSLNNIAWEYANKNDSLFYDYGRKALQASDEKDYLFGKCEALQIIGTYHYYTGALDSALIWYQLALEARREYGDSSLISGTLNNIGAVYEKRGELTRSLDFYFSAQGFIPTENQDKKARINDNIGVIYTTLGNYSEALKYNEKAKDLFAGISPKTVAHVKNQLNRANILELMANYDQALSLYRATAKAFLVYGDTLSFAKTKNNIGNIYLKKGDADSALVFYLEALAKYRSLGYLAESAGTEQNIGLLYQAKGNYKNAAVSFNSSIRKWKELENHQKNSGLLANLGDLHLLQDDFLGAEKLFLEALSQSPLSKELRSNIYDGLFFTYVKRGMFEKAIPYQLNYRSLADSIQAEEIKWRNLEAEFTESQNRLLVLEKEKEVAEEKRRKEEIIRNSLIAGIFLIFLVAVLLYLNWRVKRKMILEEKKALERQQEVERLLKDQELSSIRQVLDMQDRERKRIAQDLHDRLGSMLSMVKLHFQKTGKNIEELKKLNEEEYSKANKLLDGACDEVRKIAHDLMSGVLKNFGLLAAMQDLKTTLENSGQYHVELLSHKFEERLPNDYETVIYRIIQELVNNIIRHAEASEISFQFFMRKDVLQITVEDNGIGFDVDKTESKGMGIKGIRSRLLPLNGTIVIDSHEGRGTSVIIDIPLNAKP